MENKFCEFLVNIGIIDIKTSNNLKEINHDIINSKNVNNFSDSFFISLMHYFSNLTVNQKKYICFNLPLRYLLNKEKEKKQKIMSILFKKDLKESFIKLKHLFTWIKNIKKLKTPAPISKETSRDSLVNYKMSFDEFINNNKKKENKMKNKPKNATLNKVYSNQNINDKMKIIYSYTSNNYYNNKANDIINSKELLTTEDKKELLQLSECTFKPSINTTNNSFRNTNTNNGYHSTFEKLYKDSEKYRIKKNLRAMELDRVINKDLTFKPKLCITPKSISTIKLDNFQMRQQNFIYNKNYNTNKLKKNIENNTEKKCSFSPRINEVLNFTNYSTYNNHNVTSEENNKYFNTNNNNIHDSYYSLSTVKTMPAHVRLFDDSKRRNDSYIQKEKEYKKSLKEMANRTSKKISKVNYNKIRDLSENKEKKAILEKTKKKVEEEEGITFKPEINLNNKYVERICSNFYDRNKKNDKNKIYEKYEKIEVEEKKVEKKYTKDEKKEIINNIVQRLYKEPMSQNLLNSKSECNKYIKNNNFVNTSRANIILPNSENDWKK